MFLITNQPINTIVLSLVGLLILVVKHIKSGIKREPFWEGHFQLRNSAWIHVTSFVKQMSFEIIKDRYSATSFIPFGRRCWGDKRCGRATTIWGTGEEQQFVTPHIYGTGEMSTEISGSYMGRWEKERRISRRKYVALGHDELIRDSISKT